MHRQLALAVFAAAVAASSTACGGGGSAAAPPPVATVGAEAGTVVELDGEVTATRAGVTRPLAVGARVHDDDQIATGTGRVAISLDRNQVVWRLGPRMQEVVARSVAWSAPTAVADTVAATDEHSAAAGRHAEREAADTATSAVAQARGAAPAPAVAAASDDVPADSAAPRRKATTGARRLQLDESSGGGVGGGGAEPGLEARGGGAVDQAMVGEEATTAEPPRAPALSKSVSLAAPAPPPPPGGGAPSLDNAKGSAETIIAVPALQRSAVKLSGPLSAAAVEPALRKRDAALAACGRGEPSGAHLLTFTIGADGGVTAVTVRGGSPALTRCVTTALSAAALPTAAAATTATALLTVP